MKLIVGLVMLSTFLSACGRKSTQVGNAGAVEIHIVADTTDPHLLNPSAVPILALCGLDKDMNKAVLFRFTCITDKQLNSSIIYQLEDGATTEMDNTEDDIQYREKVVIAFYTEVEHTLDSFSAKCRSVQRLKYSECYRTIAHELTLLAASKTAQKKILIIYSDLQEKSDVFNCYRPQCQMLLQDNPKKVAWLFNKAYPLPQTLAHITVYFVYKPESRIDDQKYLSMVRVYKYLLESRGAVVIIQANNDTFQL